MGQDASQPLVDQKVSLMRMLDLCERELLATPPQFPAATVLTQTKESISKQLGWIADIERQRPSSAPTIAPQPPSTAPLVEKAHYYPQHTSTANLDAVNERSQSTQPQHYYPAEFGMH